jgi:hypothetical protein
MNPTRPARLPRHLRPCLIALVAVCGSLGAVAATAKADATREPAARRAAAASAKAPSAAAAPLTADARTLLGWVLASGDHRQQPFMVIDKRAARLWVFEPSGRVRASAPVLLGLAVGDHTVPGVGDKPLEQVLPHERTTPAGRFGVEPGRNLRGEDVIWVDYDAGVSMHRVLTTNRADRRLERLASPTVADNRISYGCINVPTRFYDEHVKPVFAHLPRDQAAVYLLPETRPLHEVFAFAPRDAGLK